MPGLYSVLGSTEAEAERGWRQLQEASDPTFRLFNLASLSGVDPTAVEDLDSDGPFAYELLERASSVTFAQTVMRTPAAMPSPSARPPSASPRCPAAAPDGHARAARRPHRDLVAGRRR